MKSGRILVALVVLFVACTPSARVPRPVDTRSQLDLGPIPPMERLLGEESLRFIRQVPGYGGYWSDKDANIHACLVDMSDKEKLRALLEPVATHQRPSLRRPIAPNRQVIIHHCDYNIAQLARWKCIVGRAAVERVPEFITWSIREPANRVNVGVKTKDGIDKVRALLAMTEVPLAAVIFEITGPIYSL